MIKLTDNALVVNDRIIPITEKDGNFVFDTGIVLNTDQIITIVMDSAIANSFINIIDLITQYTTREAKIFSHHALNLVNIIKSGLNDLNIQEEIIYNGILKDMGITIKELDELKLMPVIDTSNNHLTFMKEGKNYDKQNG